MNGFFFSFAFSLWKTVLRLDNLSTIKKFFSSLLFFISIASIFSGHLYPILGGRVKPSQKDQIQWVYGANKESRTIAFMEFENLTSSQSEVYDSYKLSLPRIIAERLKGENIIETPTNDFIPDNRDLSKIYLVKEISFDNVEKNKELMQEVFSLGKVQSLHLLTNVQEAQKTNQENAVEGVTVITNIITNQTSLGEVINTNVITNQISTKIEDMDFFYILTNNRVAYYYTNYKDQKYIFNIFKNDSQLYFDPQLLAPYQKYFVSNDIFLPTNQDGFLYYPQDRVKKKKLIISSKIYRLNNAPLGNILSQEGVDYFVYGSFKVKRKQMEVNLYIINTYEKKITHIYRESFSSSDIRNKSKLFDIVILSFLQDKDIIQNINFVSTPPGALLRLNNRFIGRLPQRLNYWVAGDYLYEVWYPQQTASRVISDSDISRTNIRIEKSDSKTEFFFEGEEKGKLMVHIKNKIPSDHYINSKLISKNQISYEEEVYPGEYFVSVVKSNYVTRNFKVNVQPNTLTSISLGIKEIKPKPLWEEIFLDYSLNTKIFAALGFAFGTASFGTFIHTLRLEDQKNSSQKRIEELEADGLGSDNEKTFLDQYTSDYNKYLAISLGLFSGSMVSFITMLVFHSLDVWDRHAPIETSFNHKGDVEIKYSQDF